MQRQLQQLWHFVSLFFPSSRRQAGVLLDFFDSVRFVRLSWQLLTQFGVQAWINMALWRCLRCLCCAAVSGAVAHIAGALNSNNSLLWHDSHVLSKAAATNSNWNYETHGRQPVRQLTHAPTPTVPLPPAQPPRLGKLKWMRRKCQNIWGRQNLHSHRKTGPKKQPMRAMLVPPQRRRGRAGEGA